MLNSFRCAKHQVLQHPAFVHPAFSNNVTILGGVEGLLCLLVGKYVTSLKQPKHSSMQGDAPDHKTISL